MSSLLEVNNEIDTPIVIKETTNSVDSAFYSSLSFDFQFTVATVDITLN